ncbi:MAG TPA: DUF4382 domain-containing protein [Candidatus Polarisedimenticolia bacterium]|nr:DUF4382 domain-containing protein [Candidatus Polarisedimenticolia bacterium]
MKISSKVALCGLLLVVLALPACSRSGSASLADQGQIQIHLTDAPIDLSNVSNVDVTITGVRVYPGVEEMNGTDTAPIVVTSHPQTFNLMSLTGGATTLLASSALPAGFYQRIRLDISAARLVFTDGTPNADLKIDSNKVDIPIRFEVKASDTTSVTLDFKADASVQVNATGSGEYILRPVVTPVPF